MFRFQAFAAVLVRFLAFLAAFVSSVASTWTSALPTPTSSGYLRVADGGEMFFAYYEARHPPSAYDEGQQPIIMWLQGGPGCASLFGNLYELGPCVLDHAGNLTTNTYAWNEHSDLLFLDQPLGTGFSKPGKGGIPTDEMRMASDLYEALQGFFGQHQNLQRRPLFITGESYAGKYVPSIGHYILQVMQQSRHGLQAATSTLTQMRPLAAHHLEPPKFRLAGLAIGDGLTDPETQVRTHADTAYYMGIIDQRQREFAQSMERKVVRLVHAGRWRKAHEVRSQLLEYIQTESGVATMLHLERWQDYDGAHHVDTFLNRPDVKDALNADPNITFVACSPKVGKVRHMHGLLAVKQGLIIEAMGPDVMRSVKYLIPDILKNIPILLYQGQFDLQDGVAASQAWIETLDWPGRHEFNKSKRHIWRMPVKGQQHNDIPTRVAGYWKSAGPLAQVVITGAGHMAPRDQGEAAQHMIETWMTYVLSGASTQVQQSR